MQLQATTIAQLELGQKANTHHSRTHTFEMPLTKRSSESASKQKDSHPLGRADIFTTQTPKKEAKRQRSANKSVASHKHNVSLSSKEWDKWGKYKPLVRCLNNPSLGAEESSQEKETYNVEKIL